MAKAIVTREAVFEAAYGLIATGDDPSILAVQGRIGGGSYSTVKRFLDAWKAERRSATPSIEVPPDITARGEELVRSLWAAAHDLAEQRIAEVRGEADQQVRQARAELQAAEVTIARLEAEAEQAAQQLDAVQGQLVEARTSLEEARTAARVAEARTTEQEQQIADLRRQGAQHREELEAARAQAMDQARLTGELSALRQQLQDQTALIERLSTR
jgi:DNA repair exonuclease SbcCD ATPase subunit